MELTIRIIKVGGSSLAKCRTFPTRPPNTPINTELQASSKTCAARHVPFRFNGFVNRSRQLHEQRVFGRVEPADHANQISFRHRGAAGRRGYGVLPDVETNTGA